jgi:hypothetical protein
MQQKRSKIRSGDDWFDERWTVNDVDRYLRITLGMRDGDALFELQEKLERERLVLHWRCTAGPNLGQEGDIPRSAWGTGLRVERDCNSNRQHGPIDFATCRVTAKNDRHVFVETLQTQTIGNVYELTVSAQDARQIAWAEQPRADQKVEPIEREEKTQGEETRLVTAIKERIAAGYRPGVKEQWKRFCDNVRESIGVEESDRGYGDKSIERIVNELRKSDKSDKSDMSDMSDMS